MKKWIKIICATSVTACHKSDHLIDYSATKRAIAIFVRSLVIYLAEKEDISKWRGSRPHWWKKLLMTFQYLEKISTKMGRTTFRSRSGLCFYCFWRDPSISSERSLMPTREILSAVKLYTSLYLGNLYKRI